MVCPPLAQPVLDAGGSAPRADRSSPGTFPHRAQKRSTTRGRDAEDATRRQRLGFTPKTPSAAEDALHPLSTSTRQRRRRRQDRSHGCAAPTGTAAIRGHTACRNTEMTQERSAWAQYGQHPALSTPQTPPAHICVELSRLPLLAPFPCMAKAAPAPTATPQQSPDPAWLLENPSLPGEMAPACTKPGPLRGKGCTETPRPPSTTGMPKAASGPGERPAAPPDGKSAPADQSRAPLPFVPLEELLHHPRRLDFVSPLFCSQRQEQINIFSVTTRGGGFGGRKPRQPPPLHCRGGGGPGF